MEKGQKKFSVVIPTFNRKSSLLKLLEQIHKQIPDRDMEMNIIVINDGSSDGTGEALREKYPGIKVIQGSGNWWWTRSVNEGCRHALDSGSHAVLLLNDDVRLDNDYFNHLLAAVRTEPDAIIGSLNLTDESPRRLFFAGAHSFNWWQGKISRYYRFLSPYEKKLSGLRLSVVLPGRGLWIPSDIFRRIGFFDQEHLPQYKADYDFVLRANENGLKTLISWDAALLIRAESTGQGATFVRRPLFGFFGSFFNKHSRTSLQKNLFYYFRHYPTWAIPLLPVTGLLVTMRQLGAFFKSRKY